MHIVPHKSRLWIVCSTVSCVHVQNTNAVLFQGLYRLQAFAESMSKCLDSHCFLPVSKYYMNQYQLSNTLQRKCGLLGTVYCQFSRMSQNGLFEDWCRLFCRSVLWNEEISKSMVPSSGLFWRRDVKIIGNEGNLLLALWRTLVKKRLLNEITRCITLMEFTLNSTPFTKKSSWIREWNSV